MDPAPIWTDLKTFPWAEFRDRVDVLTGGYPCQPFSSAGKRAGADDPRHLWPYIAEGIRILKPAICLFENVEGHITLGLSTVISDLEEMGYKAAWGIFSAAECGAPHQRKRVFIMANRQGAGLERYSRLLAGCGEPRWDAQKPAGSVDGSGDGRDIWPARPGQPQHAWEPPRVVGHSSSKRCQQDAALRGQQQTGGPCEISGKGGGEGMANSKSQRTNSGQQLCGEEWGQGRALPCESDGTGEGLGNAQNERRRRLDDESGKTSGWQARGHADGASTSEQQEQRQTQPEMGGDTDGPASRLDYAELCVTCDNRTDELRLLGNGVVPATAALAFRTLLKELIQ